jgi:hypothetical protein
MVVRIPEGHKGLDQWLGQVNPIYAKPIRLSKYLLGQGGFSHTMILTWLEPIIEILGSAEHQYKDED